MDEAPIPPRGQSLPKPTDSRDKGRSSSVGSVAPQLLEQLIRDATEAMGSVTRQFKSTPTSPRTQPLPGFPRTNVATTTKPQIAQIPIVISTPSSPSAKDLIVDEDKNFRRSYSTSSIRMMTRAEVGPSDFVKLKLLGKGDVGKVYMVVRSICAGLMFERSGKTRASCTP